MTKVREACFCAFCKNERSVFKRKTSSLGGILASAAFSLAMSFLFWQKLEPKALVFFVIGVVCSELMVHFRWRLGMICPYCGFDPLLYKKSPAQACEKVKTFMDHRKQDPMFYLSGKGYDKLHRIRRIVEEAKEAESISLKANQDVKIPLGKSTETDAQKAIDGDRVKSDLLDMPPV